VMSGHKPADREAIRTGAARKDRILHQLSDGKRFRVARFVQKFRLPHGSSLGACPTLTFLLRQTMHRHLRCSRRRKILNVFQRIRFRFFSACGLASAGASFVS
jgi:hypothetical protein